MDLEISFGVPMKQRRRVATIIHTTFESKLHRIIGFDQFSSLVVEHLRNDRILVAWDKGVIVGVGGLKFEGKDFLEITNSQLLRALHYNVVRFTLLGLMFYDSVDQKELLLDVLAVSHERRSRGIGTQIIQYVINFAHSQGFDKVKLSVVDTNERAKQLYQRLGFQVSKIQRIPFPWNRIYGINSASEMTYRLS